MTNPILALAALAAFAQDAPENTSGGKLSEEEAAYDVLHYDLDLRVIPAAKSIEGTLRMTAVVVQPTREITLDLDPALEVRGAHLDGREIHVRHVDGVVWVTEPFTPAGRTFELALEYGGTPREAPRPPWDGGFTWATTEDGSPWIATSCQGEGADLWWPCKDHPSDEPDSMDLHFTVPEGLVVASNGRHMGDEEGTGDDDGWVTSHWHVSTPISNYTVAFNAAPYEVLRTEATSVTGETYPVVFWALPESVEKARAFLPEVLDHLAFFEEACGPYPFRADKYGVVETPHLGMEHQTIIAYGNGYRSDALADYDWLHHHELSHEWWANLVTARDWADMWIHEGIGTYMQALYLERRFGPEVYRRKLAQDARRILNRGPIAPPPPRSTQEVYFAESGPTAPGIDVYMKAAWVVHTLRWHVGDEAFFRVLRRWAYPDPALEEATDGSACRFADTDEMVAIAEEHTDLELDWFFDAYLRHAELPRLDVEREDGTLALRWTTPAGEFPLAVPVRVGDEIVRVETPGGEGTLAVGDAEVEVDPERRLLRDTDGD